MKNGKKPTLAQKKFLQGKGLVPENWLIVKDTPVELVVVSRKEVRVCFRVLQCRRARIVTKRMLDGSVKRYTEVRKAGG